MASMPQCVTRHTSWDDLPQYLTVEELMIVLDIGRSSAYAFARAHGTRFGRIVRIHKDALKSQVSVEHGPQR
jgi:hypothetical protein